VLCLQAWQEIEPCPSEESWWLGCCGDVGRLLFVVVGVPVLAVVSLIPTLLALLYWGTIQRWIYSCCCDNRPDDRHWDESSLPPHRDLEGRCRRASYSTRYLRMRDGVLLAVDVWLPEEAQQEEREEELDVPGGGLGERAVGGATTTTTTTRRATTGKPKKVACPPPMPIQPQLHPPMASESPLQRGSTGERRVPLLQPRVHRHRRIRPRPGRCPNYHIWTYDPRFYSLVQVDVRGSGASGGVYSSLWSEAERLDSGEVLESIPPAYKGSRIEAYTSIYSNK
jgi:hypothetical protein